MPQNTPSIKVDAVRSFGGEVLYMVLISMKPSKAIGFQEKNMTFIPPFDHH